MRTALLILGLTLSIPTALAAGDDPRLSLHVSPSVAIEPAIVTVRATIGADADNRGLEVIVESDAFRRSSQITLDGRNAPRLNVFELRDIPSGLYEVRAVLVGPSGPRVSKLQVVKIEPARGR
jgi:hypothetical protein